MELPLHGELPLADRGRSRDKEYLNVLKSSSEDALEELLIELEKDISNYLRHNLPPKTDFNVTLSIVKKDYGVDISAEVAIRGHSEYQGNFSKIAQDAINYIKRKLIELLEAKRQHEK